MPDIKVAEAWDRIEGMVKELNEHEIFTIRKGDKFMYEFDMGSHNICAWVVAEAPRYHVIIDDCFTLRCSNIKALKALIRMATVSPTRWTGEMVWDE